MYSLYYLFTTLKRINTVPSHGTKLAVNLSLLQSNQLIISYGIKKPDGYIMYKSYDFIVPNNVINIINET